MIRMLAMWLALANETLQKANILHLCRKVQNSSEIVVFVKNVFQMELLLLPGDINKELAWGRDTDTHYQHIKT